MTDPITAVVRAVLHGVKLFADEWVRTQFERSFADGDWSRVRDELEEALARNQETKAFGRLHYADLARCCVS